MSVVSRLQSGTGQHLFYVLKITGLPYVFCSVHNPYSAAKFGASALALPAGYTAVGGMDLPNDTLTQEITDIVGGVASAERIKLKLIDFQASDAGGQYQVLARLFSPGIATSTPGGYFELMSDIPASMGAGGAVSLRSGTVTPADGYYTVGKETLRLESFGAPVAGISTGVIVGDRNRFPCSSVYPVIPSHRVVRNETDGGALGRNILVTPCSAPFSMVGRSAAFYIGALDSNGAPLPEAEWQLRLLGRVKSVGDAGGITYEIEIESVIDDLGGALVAPGLGIARIADDQIFLPAGTMLRDGRNPMLECELHLGNTGGSQFRRVPIQIDDTGVVDSRYTLEDLIRRVNAAIAAKVSFFGGSFAAIPHCTTDAGDDGLLHVVFWAYRYTDAVSFTMLRFRGDSFTGFLDALGFPRSETGTIDVELSELLPVVSTDPLIKGIARAVAPRPAPSVFIPVAQSSFVGPSRFEVSGMDGSTSQNFFTNQGDGRAFVQLGDGPVVKINAIDTTDGPLKLTTGPRWRQMMGRNQTVDDSTPPPFYYAGINEKAAVRQVILAGNRDEETDAGLLVGRLLASHDEGSAIDDLNHYPDGVGLGWNRVLDGDSVRAISSYGRSWPREYVITSQTKMDEILPAMLKVYGLAVVWDPETARVVFRPLRFPTAANAHNIPLSDSNRTKVDDETARVIDASNVRTSWLLKWGWDWVEEKFVGTDINIIDNTVASTGIAEKPEKIEDKTIWIRENDDAFKYLGELFARGFLYQQPWLRCSRTLGRFGLTLAPGTYHLIVDRNLVNPFTGRRGVTAADRLYGMLISVSGNPASPDKGTCTFLLNQYRKSGLFRSWAPCGLVDYDAADHGYDAGTGVVTMARRYSSHATFHDGYDFRAGDFVRLMAWNVSETALAYDENTTIVAVATDGSTITVASGLPAIADDVEVLVVLREYVNATAARIEEVAFQGDGEAMVIEGTPGAELHRWA
jgi:hypothetical protein